MPTLDTPANVVAMSAQVHIVSKRDHSNHASIPVDTTPSPFAHSSAVRVRTSLIGLSKNNLVCATAGGVLGRCNAFPVPENLPAPYDNSDEWCFVPAWGYTEVIESTTDIPVGSFFFGFWPTSSYYHDLRLEPDRASLERDKNAFFITASQDGKPSDIGGIIAT